ncbi:MAG: exonuclease I [Gammaproteobacteria bacterium SG8_11]|nr:MAG: exonuclease I [Gammaproteobacteria bacterium SG8_11]
MNTPNSSIYWYDLETFGIDPKYFRIAQFAGIRTDLELNIIDDPLVMYCKPSDDFLPDPYSCLVTGITPQIAQSKGSIEAEFIAKIHQEFSKPSTCVAGYNNIRFDDEFVRYTLYRNFFDPYQREWMHGNSRWDIIDMVRLTKALRPQGIQWPVKEDGAPSYKLEDLTWANHIQHESAHDALSDVYATIAVANLIKTRQPKLYEFVFQHKDKQSLLALLNVHVRKPVLHVSGMYPAERGCTAMVLPLALHPVNKNAIIVYDLNVDPADLLTLSSEEIQQRVFTAQDQLPEGVNRIPLKAVHVNKCPIVVPVNTLDDESAHRLGIDKARCLQHANTLRDATDLSEKIATAFTPNGQDFNTDPDFSLYGGFFSDSDKQKMDIIRSTPPEKLSSLAQTFQDRRLPEMLYRYRARNYYETLSHEEKLQWQEFRGLRLNDPEMPMDLQRFNETLTALETSADINAAQHSVIKQLTMYMADIKSD